MPTETEILWTYFHAADEYRRQLETRLDTGILFGAYDTARRHYIEADFAVRDLEKRINAVEKEHQPIWWAFTDGRGREVKFINDPYIDKANRKCFIDGKEVVIMSVQRYRDGGTTVIETALGTYTRPAPFRKGGS